MAKIYATTTPRSLRIEVTLSGVTEVHFGGKQFHLKPGMTLELDVAHVVGVDVSRLIQAKVLAVQALTGTF